MTEDDRDPGGTGLVALTDRESAPELRRHFLQNLVHELSSPLTPLIGYLKLFNKRSLGPINELQERCLLRMDRSAHRLKHVLDDLSYLLQMESGMVSIQDPVPIALDQVVHHCLEQNREEAEEAQIDVLLEISSEVLDVDGDETLLNMAVGHLLSNAFKFNSAGGKLLIRCYTEQRQVVLEVFDSGVGIEAAVIKRVFEPFYQADHKATRRFGGAGLGLPLVRWIAILHDGQIALESPPSLQPEGHYFRGTRAILKLPQHEPVTGS